MDGRRPPASPGAGSAGPAVGGRLLEGSGPKLIQSAHRLELQSAGALLPAMILADLAHILVLLDHNLVPREAGRQLLAALLELRTAGLAGTPSGAGEQAPVDGPHPRPRPGRPADEPRGVAAGAGGRGGGLPARRPATARGRHGRVPPRDAGSGPRPGRRARAAPEVARRPRGGPPPHAGGRLHVLATRAGDDARPQPARLRLPAGARGGAAADRLRTHEHQPGRGRLHERGRDPDRPCGPRPPARLRRGRPPHPGR